MLEEALERLPAGDSRLRSQVLARLSVLLYYTPGVSFEQVLSTVPDPSDACQQLIDLANEGGGPDNITCVIADVIDPAALEEDAGSEPNWWQRLLGG